MDFFKSLVYVSLWLVGVLESADLQRIKYNNPGFMVDLGVGLWAWPMPVGWNGDKGPDLLIGAEDGFLYYGRNSRKP